LENLRTERLTLVVLTPELAQVALDDRAKLEQMLGARVPEAWPGADCATILPRIARGVEQTGVEPTRLIGHPTDLGRLEIGYTIVPDYRGRGFASEATPALIERAFERPGIRRIIAECLDYNVASLKGLERMGMRHVSSAGETLRFELRK
jgi:ribosomal-protein-alanine N-acetyltransferase